MKRIILLIITAFLHQALAAQESLRFEPSEWNFGTILETDGRVSHTFTGENVGDTPLVILDVVTTCGCTAPTFSKQPILPGGKTSITVTYDPANRPGAFDKELWVYSSEGKRVATLRVRGNVTPRPKSIEELYPVDAGGGLRLSATLCTFAYLYPGRMMQSALGFVNDSRRTIRLDLQPVAESGLLKVEYPRQIAPGERGQINLAYLIPAGNPRYGTLRDALEVEVDGRGNGTTLVAHGIGVDLPPAETVSALPKAEISENFIKFGPVRRTGAVQRRELTLSNTGSADLIVRAVENEGHVAVSLAPGQRLAPGDSARIEVSLDPSKQEYGVLSEHVVVITNDPARPMRRLRVTAIIEQ